MRNAPVKGGTVGGVVGGTIGGTGRLTTTQRVYARVVFGPFSTVEVIALCGIEESLSNAKAFVQEMMAGMASR